MRFWPRSTNTVGWRWEERRRIEERRTPSGLRYVREFKDDQRASISQKPNEVFLVIQLAASSEDLASFDEFLAHSGP